MLRRALGFTFLALAALSTFAAPNNPFVGDWKLNASKSALTDKMTVKHIDGDKYTFDFGGGPETIVVDGTDQPSNFYGGDTLSVSVEGDTWKVVRKAKGKPMISAVWSLSADGGKLTDRFIGFGGDGLPRTVVHTYERKAPGARFAGTWVGTDLQAVDFFLGLQLRPFEETGLSIIDSSSQLLPNMDFPTPQVRRPDERALELLRKNLSLLMRLDLSPDLKTLTITVHSVAMPEPQILVLDRQASS